RTALPPTRSGHIGRRAQINLCILLRSAIHEEPSVKTGARRLRDFPDIHSASSAAAERHEKVCGCFHSHRRRRDAPWRTPGCNLSPTLDLDVDLDGPPFACRFTIRVRRLEPYAPAR